MWALAVTSIVVAFLVYLVLTQVELGSVFSKETENIDKSGTLLSIGENPSLEDKQLTILSDGLKAYTLKSLSNFTVSMFLKVNYMPRTGTFIDCEMDPSTYSGKYDCKDSKFTKCKLGTANTNNPTCLRQGYKSLFRLGNAIRFELLETQNPQRPGIARAQLSVKTQELGDSSTMWMETYSLPEFPLQKWMMLTIVRSGNIYTVYYNDRISGSFKTEYVPYVDSGKVILGEGTSMKGVGVYLSVFSRNLSAGDITNRYSSFTDTNGQPKLPYLTGMNIGGLCMSGNCFKGPSVKPANPLVEWTQEYS